MTARQNRYLLANRIIDLIGNLRLKEGHHLTEQFLAGELEVSRTPVRSALDLLEMQGVVASKPNQGYFLAKPWSEIEHLALDIPNTESQEVYTAIIRDRLAGELSEKISQKELEIRYATNRNTLLRALSRLSDEGLVERSPGRGWIFMPTLQGDTALHDSYAFRAAIEPAGIGMATFHADPVTLKRARMGHEYLLTASNLNSVDAVQLFEMDSEFHEMLARFSNNSFLLLAVQNQNRLRKLLEFHTYTNITRVRDWIREHILVMDNIGKGDLKAAAEALSAHLQKAGKHGVLTSPSRE